MIIGSKCYLLGAIRRIIELRINHKKIKSSIQNRIKTTPNGINNKNIVYIQREGTKPQANFTIATCNIQSLKNKELQVSELISDYSIDALVITETWLKAKDDHWKGTTPLNRNSLKLHTADQARGKGGGIAVITKNHYQVNLVAKHNSRLNSFECTTWKVTAKNTTFTIHCVYHPPYSLTNKTTNGIFIDEFTDFASTFLPDHSNNIFIGDFNLHVSDPNNNDSAIFNDTIEAMGLIQHVGKSTHKSGNMLDLIISEIQGDTTVKTVNTGPYLSDHCVVIATLKAKRSNPRTKVKLIRGTSKITEEQWCEEFNVQNIKLTDNLDAKPWHP